MNDAQLREIDRPEPALLKYYLLRSLVLGPFFFVLLIPLYFRYYTLRYRFDDEGISMRWGILFRKEIHLTYARIQDIHLISNILERWLNLARIKVQTASGSSKAEMTIEGVHEFEQLRDFIYTKMRGFKQGSAATAGAGATSAQAAAPVTADAGDGGELAQVLTEVAGELRAIRQALERRS